MKIINKILFFTVILGIQFISLAACQSKEENISNLTTPDGAPLLSATVTNVVDGDTIDVEIDGQEERVRLLLVDTPETKHPSKPIQPFGPEASEYTKTTLLGKQVGLEKDVSERDRYGRVLAYIWLDDRMHNEALIEKGLARVATFPPDIKYVDRFREKQSEAQQNGVGIWSMEDYVQDKGFDTSIPDDDQKIDGNCVGIIKGNRNSKIYHLEGGAHYDDVATHNIVWFCSEKEAEEAGYRKSKN
jgi:micrococcal nuclease